MGHDDSSEKNKVFLIDFGLSKKYRNSLTMERRPHVIRYKRLVGTQMFAPLAAEEGIEQSTKDDMEGLGYILY